MIHNNGKVNNRNEMKWNSRTAINRFKSLGPKPHTLIARLRFLFPINSNRFTSIKIGYEISQRRKIFSFKMIRNAECLFDRRQNQEPDAIHLHLLIPILFDGIVSFSTRTLMLLANCNHRSPHRQTHWFRLGQAFFLSILQLCFFTYVACVCILVAYFSRNRRKFAI